MTVQERAEELHQMYDDAFDFRDWQTIDWICDELDREPELLVAFRALSPEEGDA